MVETEAGPFRMRWYVDRVHGRLHLALVRGEAGAAPPLVRVHLRDTPRDLIGIRGEHAGWTLGAALERIAREPHGIVVLLRPEESPEDIIGAGAHEHGADAAGAARCCAPTASARRSCATSASPACACCRRRASCSASPRSASRSPVTRSERGRA